jgi:molybdate transport system ATP-binding protein
MARVQLLAREVILATRQPDYLSVRNAIEGVIAEMAADEADACLVRIDIGGAFVLSRVTKAAVEDLQLRTGSRVWALIKAVSVRGHAFNPPASAATST